MAVFAAVGSALLGRVPASRGRELGLAESNRGEHVFEQVNELLVGVKWHANGTA